MRSALQTAARPALSLPRAMPSSSRKITLPATEIIPKEGETTSFVVRCDNVIDNPATALRLVREVEKELGPVIKIDMPKDQDMRRGFKFLSVETLRPSALPEPIKGELGASYVDKDVNQGGVSMTDVMTALGAEGQSRRSTRAVARMNYKIDARTNARAARQRPPPAPTMAQKREDSDIVAALRQLDSGFYGGFAGLADRFKDLEIPAEAQPPVNGARVKKANKPKRTELQAESETQAQGQAQPAQRKVEEPKETGPRKTFAEIVAEQRAAKLAVMAEAEAAARAEAEKNAPVVAEEQTEEEDVIAARKEKLAHMALKRARRAAAAQKKAEAHRDALEAARVAEEKRLQELKEEEEKKNKKKGWF